MQRFSALYFAIIVSLLVVVAGLLHALKQHPPYAPEIHANQQPERGLQDKNEGNSEAENRPRVVPSGPAIGKFGEHERKPETKDHGEEGTEFWPPLYGYRLKITDTLIAGFTALLFWATWLLWRATRRLVSGADDTSRRQLRAYVSGSVFHISSFDVDELAIFKIRLENVGITPARKVAHHSVVVVAPEPLPDSFEFPPITTPLSNPANIFPKQGFEGSTVATSIFTSEERTRIIAGTSRIYCVGEIFYETAFGQECHTRFCVAAVADQETMRKLASGYRKADLTVTFHIARIGNEDT
jgi:hypothetical protein